MTILQKVLAMAL